MHGDDLPDILSVASIALTLVVVLYARATVREARKATDEERNTVTELKALIGVVSDLAASAAGTLQAAQRTAVQGARAHEVEQLRAMLNLTEQLEKASYERNWKRSEDLQKTLAAVRGDFPRSLPCTSAAVASSAANFSELNDAAVKAITEIQGELRRLGVPPGQWR
jgi:hypothetical protein